MNLIRITEPGDPRLERLIPLYEEAFPECERRDIRPIETLDAREAGNAFQRDRM